MKIYAICVYDGKEVIEREVLLYQSAVNNFVRDEQRKGLFITVDSYTRKERRNSKYDNIDITYLINSFVFLDGIEVYRDNKVITSKDMEAVKETLTQIIHVDGTITYLPPYPLSTPDVQEITGSMIFTMYVVQEEPQRWATLSIDPVQFDLKEKPQLNKVATERFGIDLYGDVLFIDENLVA